MLLELGRCRGKDCLDGGCREWASGLCETCKTVLSIIVECIMSVHKQLLRHGANVYRCSRGEKGGTALHIAVANHVSPEIIQTLLLYRKL